MLKMKWMQILKICIHFRLSKKARDHKQRKYKKRAFAKIYIRKKANMHTFKIP